MLRTRSLLVSGVVLGLVLVACSGGGGGDDSSTTPDSGSGGQDATVTMTTDSGSTADASTTKKDAGGGGSDASMSCAPKCAVGTACMKDTDCASGACGADGKCATSAATDGKKDDGESDIDCGGATTDMAPKCALGKLCLANADCMNNACGASGTCATSAANDGIQDDGESDIDCGGTTTDGAAKCAVGKMCVADVDCASGACGVGNTCAVSGSTDGKQDFGESDIDCGGHSTDAAPLCPTNDKCVNGQDCTSGVCGLGNLCAANGYTDGLQDFNESDIDCGGNTTDGAPVCADGKKCVKANDCGATSVCDLTNVCAQPTSTDGIKDGTETDIDCGGGAPTNALPCTKGKTCLVGTDCTSGGCNYLGKCADAISCTGQHGGDTCGPTGATESCCTTIAKDATLPAGSVATASIDKYNITAGRMRAFVTATNGDIRTWVMNHKPAWWQDAWTAGLPNELDDGSAGPTCCVAGDPMCTGGKVVGQSCGFYQEVGPYVHGSGAVGANEGCYVTGYGARTYRLPNATNANMSDIQTYSQAEMDDRAMQCVTSYITAAFCAWDGGHMPTAAQITHLWHNTLFPWGGGPAGAACASNATCLGGTVCSGGHCQAPAATGVANPPVQQGAPAGYSMANDVDPQNGVRGTQPSYGTISYGNYFSNPPYGGTAPNVTAIQLIDMQWANYDMNYWGGLTQTHVAYCASSNTVCVEGGACAGAPANKCPTATGGADQSLFIAPPGRFPNGNGFYGHADLGGNVFNATDMGVNNTIWSLSGSWQGHPIPWPGGAVNAPSYYKYWAMGGRCAR